MTTKQNQEERKWLVEELENFQEIARYLNPSPGEIPTLEGIDICGLSLPLREEIGGDHLIYLDFNRRYDLDGRVAGAMRASRDSIIVRSYPIPRRRPLPGQAGIPPVPGEGSLVACGVSCP